MIHQFHISQFVDNRESGNVAPFRPWACFGCGTSLYFHRHLESGVFQAEAWITLVLIPLLPLATWIIYPRRRSTREGDGIYIETFEFEFLEKQPMTAIRFLAMLNRAVGRINLALGPLILCYLHAIRTEMGKPTMLEAVLFLASAGWAWAPTYHWGKRREVIYEHAEALSSSPK